ncbi:hypothetical protein GCM10022243_57200 [Saccharothrix violaceirubra]|uniref:Uncharacterized protein n=1 Tax=Saccharothrix violaceirubra TaxID=413306 RepID=A0A7W7T4F0_9PSEU|nr:hypothetical protein [Saccharothrix violaceirubra]MBB4965847.1 hypothetical protein [Saccharothrix violaceirubra]
MNTKAGHICGHHGTRPRTSCPSHNRVSPAEVVLAVATLVFTGVLLDAAHPVRTAVSVPVAVVLLVVIVVRTRPGLLMRRLLHALVTAEAGATA